MGPFDFAPIQATTDGVNVILTLPNQITAWTDRTRFVAVTGGGVDYAGELFGRTITFPLPSGSGDVVVTFRSTFHNGSVYTERVVIKRPAPATGSTSSSTIS